MTTRVPGSCVMMVTRGASAAGEIQALVDTSHLPNARRLSVGLGKTHLAMLPSGTATRASRG